jgi:RND family efflux transporter MFP subunit
MKGSLVRARIPTAALPLLLAAACSRGTGTDGAPTPASAAVAPAPVPARLIEPTPVRYAPRVTATGMLKARQSAPLAMSVPGTLARIAVQRGQEVKAGALLAALDDRLAAATARQAEAGLASARAQLALAEDGLVRVEEIRRAEGASESQLVVARAQRDLAQAGVAGAQAQLDQAKVNLSHHYLTAPFPGVVTRVPDGIGITVGAGTPLVVLASSRRLVLETTLTQEEAAEVRAGEKVVVSVEQSGARTTEAVVSVVVPAVDPGTNRVPVEIEVPNADGRFLVNAFARAELPRGKERDAFRVPAAALVQRGGAYALWVAGGDGRARVLPVQVLGEEGATSVVVPATGEWPETTRVVELPPIGIEEGTQLGEVRG